MSNENNAMKKQDNSLNILDIHNDLLSVILNKVGEESHSDLVGCILSCRTFHCVFKYPNVLKSLNLDGTFPLPMLRIPEKLKFDFLQDCAQAGNLHVVFLCGLIDYYFVKETVSGSRKLKLAADANHPEAMYLCGMVLINENQLTEGSKYLKRLWDDKGFAAVRLCMENCRNVILEVSVREFREYEILLAIMEIGEGCVVADFEEVCDKCFIYKEIYRFIDYMNIN